MPSSTIHIKTIWRPNNTQGPTNTQQNKRAKKKQQPKTERDAQARRKISPNIKKKKKFVPN